MASETIPVTIRKSMPQEKFIPLIVSYNNQPRPAKLYDTKTIEDTISEILKTYDMLKDQKASYYGLKLKRNNKTQYINESNRFDLLALNDEIKFHDVVLCFNMHVEAKSLIEKLTPLKLINQSDNIISLLNELELNIENDKNFAFEIYANKGKSLLIDFILKWQESPNDIKQYKILYGLYKNLNILMQQCNISWDSSDIDVNVIKVVCDILNNTHKQQTSKKITSPNAAGMQNTIEQLLDIELDRIILLFLNILNNIINQTEQMRQFCIRNLKYNEIIFLLSRKCVLIKDDLLILINNSFLKCDMELKLRLCDIMYQISVKQLMSNLCMSLKYEHNLFKNLFILQKNILNIKCLKLFDEYNCNEKIMEVLQYICENSFKLNMQQYDEKYYYKRLGFTNPSDPLEDFETLKSMTTKNSSTYLALEFMRYFVDTYKIALQNIVSDEKTTKSPDYLFPFARASIAIVKLIYTQLEINKPYNELTAKEIESLKIYQLIFVLFYQSIDGLYEFFSNCLILFYKLWTDMKAQQMDFERALLVFKDSLIKILTELNSQNKNEMYYYKKIEQFYLSMRALNYDKIKIPNLTEKLNKQPFRQLKQMLTDEVMCMIRPKRMHVLCKGENFYTKLLSKGSDKKGRNKQYFWKLTNDLTQFSYTDNDLSDTDIGKRDALQIENIKEIKKEEARKDRYQFNNIQIVYLSNDKLTTETYVLGNENESVIDLWYESLNMLIDPKTTSNVTCFVECLFDTQLLELHKLGLNCVPNDIPQVPDLPEDFNFYEL